MAASLLPLKTTTCAALYKPNAQSSAIAGLASMSNVDILCKASQTIVPPRGHQGRETMRTAPAQAHSHSAARMAPARNHHTYTAHACRALHPKVP